MARIKYIAVLWILALFCTLPVSAQETEEEINAQILQTVWFSTLSAEEENSVRVYSAVQNNSGIEFSGEAVFYVDDKEFARKSFVSPTDALTEISADWSAVGGRHTFQVKLEPDLLEDKKLLSYESDETELNVSRQITLEEVKESAGNILTTVVEKIDETALALSERLIATKKPQVSASESSGDQQETIAQDESEVLGASSAGGSDASSSVYNTGVDIVNALLRNWIWTLSGLVVLILFWSFRF